MKVVFRAMTWKNAAFILLPYTELCCSLTVLCLWCHSNIYKPNTAGKYSTCIHRVSVMFQGRVQRTFRREIICYRKPRNDHNRTWTRTTILTLHLVVTPFTTIRWTEKNIYQWHRSCTFILIQWTCDILFLFSTNNSTELEKPHFTSSRACMFHVDQRSYAIKDYLCQYLHCMLIRL